MTPRSSTRCRRPRAAPAALVSHAAPAAFLGHAALAAALSLAAAGAGAQPAPAGRWLTESGNLEVEIAPCGDALCGTVVRVLANRSMAAPGQAMVAADPRPALGMTLLRDLRPDGDGALGGQLYNRENAKTYSVRLTLDGADQLLVRGYIGLPIFGQTQLWRRVPAGGGQP